MLEFKNEAAKKSATVEAGSRILFLHKSFLCASLRASAVRKEKRRRRKKRLK